MLMDALREILLVQWRALGGNDAAGCSVHHRVQPGKVGGILTSAQTSSNASMMTV